ncbi:MAG: hypothetical protein PF542_04300 [Nanoarchaeota archaeon]|nr:hypothetical protein [Nanoarchaeota archaeon]
MGFFDGIAGMFRKKEKEQPIEPIEIREEYLCNYPECQNRREEECRLCGKRFCGEHKEPISHFCGRREISPGRMAVGEEIEKVNVIPETKEVVKEEADVSKMLE